MLSKQQKEDISYAMFPKAIKEFEKWAKNVDVEFMSESELSDQFEEYMPWPEHYLGRRQITIYDYHTTFGILTKDIFSNALLDRIEEHFYEFYNLNLLNSNYFIPKIVEDLQSHLERTINDKWLSYKKASAAYEKVVDFYGGTLIKFLENSVEKNANSLNFLEMSQTLIPIKEYTKILLKITQATQNRASCYQQITAELNDFLYDHYAKHKAANDLVVFPEQSSLNTTQWLYQAAKGIMYQGVFAGLKYAVKHPVQTIFIGFSLLGTIAQALKPSGHLSGDQNRLNEDGDGLSVRENKLFISELTVRSQLNEYVVTKPVTSSLERKGYKKTTGTYREVIKYSLGRSIKTHENSEKKKAHLILRIKQSGNNKYSRGLGSETTVISGNVYYSNVVSVSDGAYSVLYRLNDGIYMKRFVPNNPDGLPICLGGYGALISSCLLNDGNIAVAWKSTVYNPPLRVNIFTPNGVRVINQIAINAYSWSQVATLSNGFVVCYDKESAGAWQVQCQRFLNNGAFVGSVVVVNDMTSVSETLPSVVATNSGFLVVWRQENQVINKNCQIWGQAFDLNGNRISGNFQISNSLTVNAGEFCMGRPSVQRTENQNFLTAWAESVNYQTTGNAAYKVRSMTQMLTQGNIYNLTATNQGNIDTPINNICAVGNNMNLIVWSNNQTGDYDIYALIIDDNGILLSQPFKINEITQTEQINPQLAALPNATATAVWQSTNGNLADTIEQRKIMVPILTKKQININAGETRTLTSNDIAVTENGLLLGNIAFNITQTANVQIERKTAPNIAINTFNQQDIINQNLQLVASNQANVSNIKLTFSYQGSSGIIQMLATDAQITVPTLVPVATTQTQFSSTQMNNPTSLPVATQAQTHQSSTTQITNPTLVPMPTQTSTESNRTIAPTMTYNKNSITKNAGTTLIPVDNTKTPTYEPTTKAPVKNTSGGYKPVANNNALILGGSLVGAAILAIVGIGLFKYRDKVKKFCTDGCVPPTDIPKNLNNNNGNGASTDTFTEKRISENSHCPPTDKNLDEEFFNNSRNLTNSK